MDKLPQSYLDEVEDSEDPIILLGALKKIRQYTTTIPEDDLPQFEEIAEQILNLEARYDEAAAKIKFLQGTDRPSHALIRE